MRYFIKLSYDGTRFCGWQVQPNALTVQECLEKSLSTLLKARVSVVGAGRTDTQVNAVGYVAHFDFDGPVPQFLSDDAGELDATKTGYKLNAILPKDIVVHDVWKVEGDLHARFSATRREYTYFIHRTKDPFVGSHSYFCPWPLDVEAMNRAASYLVGTHDFRCFEKIGSDNRTSVCTVSEAGWFSYEPVGVSVLGLHAPGGTYMYFRISADRFLRNMVRAVVGSLLEVGRGRRSVEDFASLVLPVSTVSEETGHIAEDGTPFRSMAGESVPGFALFLSDIRY
ncbi:MAG: tRNA pseudouridine(38-40) synthase TruA [Bacteroidia bacterium]|nr:tRNA pseudouridine(38-40) synthase TruA [Bacteroidia bacterium]